MISPAEDGRDFEFAGMPGRMLHNHPQDRNSAEFGGINTIAIGGPHAMTAGNGQRELTSFFR